MNVFFLLRSSEYLRLYEATILDLCERGHTVSVGVVALNKRREVGLAALGRRHDRIRIAGPVLKRRDDWKPVANATRGAMDALRFLHPRYARSHALRHRMFRKAAPPFLRPLERLRTLPAWSVRGLLRGLEGFETLIPSSERIEHLLAEHSPDVVVVTPLVGARSTQVDYVKSAAALGIPSVVCIASWDNLTNKGQLRVRPDRVLVWNETQKQEAIDLHGIPADRIVVTGAQNFDAWFERRQPTPRERFCLEVGLPPQRPVIAFLGSSPFISEHEAEVDFVRAWLRALRSAGGVLADAGVLVRPHPYNAAGWESVTLDDLGPAVVWPRRRGETSVEAAHQTYLDSLFHSAVVVGVNTSAMIEAAIVGRPVLTLQDQRFEYSQAGTLHFPYLLAENDGFVVSASNMQGHLRQLADVLSGDDGCVRRSRAFVQRFVRPRGLDAPCTPLVAAEIEKAAQLPRAREARAPRSLRLARGLLARCLRVRSVFQPRAAWRPALPSPELLAFSAEAAGRSLNIQFFMLHMGFLRFYEETIRLLVERGHRVRLIFEEHGAWGGDAALGRLQARSVSVAWSTRSKGRWTELAKSLRGSIEYLRYLAPSYAGMPRLRERAEEGCPPAMLRFAGSRLAGSYVARRLVGGVLRVLERSLPAGDDAYKLLRKTQADVVLFTPLVGLRQHQPDDLRAAKELRLRTALCVASWDHLSSKALLRDMPDRVFVWNETQKAEAVRMHGVPPERVTVTGAQVYDWAFTARARPRNEFLGRLGLPEGGPLLTYVCSSPYRGGLSEAELVAKEWLPGLRGCGIPRLADASVLIRPHPKRAGEWRGVNLSGLGAVVVWPRDGAAPMDPDSKADYFDSLYHSCVVVGLNTSALIEAGIVGRPVCAVPADSMSESQTRTPHFRYLTEVGGGLLHVSRNLEEHWQQLASAIDARGREAARTRAFTRAFVRPHGLDVAATPLLARAIEELAASPQPAPWSRWWMPLVRLALLPSAARLDEERRRAKLQRAQQLGKAAPSTPAPGGEADDAPTERPDPAAGAAPLRDALAEAPDSPAAAEPE